MLDRIVGFSLDHRWLTLCILAGFIVVSCYIATRIPIDAFPDLTNNQVVVITECPGLSPSRWSNPSPSPLKRAVMGLPHTESVRSISKLGLSTVTIILEDHVNTWFARQMVNERCRKCVAPARRTRTHRWAPSRQHLARSTSTPSKVRRR